MFNPSINRHFLPSDVGIDTVGPVSGRRSTLSLQKVNAENENKNVSLDSDI